MSEALIAALIGAIATIVAAIIATWWKNPGLRPTVNGPKPDTDHGSDQRPTAIKVIDQPPPLPPLPPPSPSTTFGTGHITTGPPAPSIRIESLQPQPLIVVAGSFALLTVRVARQNFNGPLTVGVEELPTGITYPASRIEVRGLESDVQLTAAQSAPLGWISARVVVRGDGVQAEETLSVEVTPPRPDPPNLECRPRRARETDLAENLGCRRGTASGAMSQAVLAVLSRQETCTPDEAYDEFSPGRYTYTSTRTVDARVMAEHMQAVSRNGRLVRCGNAYRLPW